MDCKEFRELLDAHVDGELSPEATRSAWAHLERCVGCSRVEQQLLQLRRAVKRVVNEHEPPAALVHNVRSLARPGWRRLIPQSLAGSQPMIAGTEISFWRKRIAVPTPAFALLVIALLVLSSWMIFLRPGSQSPSSPNVKKQAPAPSVSPPTSGFDLAQFDRGERAAIYKVRVADHGNQQP